MLSQGGVASGGGLAMDEREFEGLANAMLARIEAALEGCTADFDYEVKPGGVLELEFEDGSKIIVNRHNAAREIWLAAKSGGFHFRPEVANGECRWAGTRDGVELLEALARAMGAQAGREIHLT